MTDSLRYKEKDFRDIVEQKFNDALHKAGGKWSDCSQLMDDHWEALMEIMNSEITERAENFVEEQERESGRFDPDPSLSAYERNPNLC